jgi:hypothetical protein
MQKNKFSILAAVLLLLVAPFFASAQVTTVCDLFNLVVKAGRLFGTLIAILAVIFLLYSAFLFITGGGNEETRTTAREYLIYSLVGIAIALLSSFGVAIVFDFVRSGSLTSQCAGGSINPPPQQPGPDDPENNPFFGNPPTPVGPEF